MEDKKKQKIIKIAFWTLIAAIILSIIIMSIVSAVKKNQTDKINNDNSQIEDLLDNQNSEINLSENEW